LLENRVISEFLSVFGEFSGIRSPFRTLFQGPTARGNLRGSVTCWSFFQSCPEKSSSVKSSRNQ